MNAYKPALQLECGRGLQNGSQVFLIDAVEDEKSRITDNMEISSLQKDTASMLKTLKEREQIVISLRFGLDGGEKQTLEAIGKIYGVTKECIRQTEARALNKLKHSREALQAYSDYICAV